MLERTVAIGALLLDDGTWLSSVEQHATIYGRPKPDGSNVALVAHALTGSSRVAEWWPGMVGEGALFDPREWCIVGINALGGCYGSTSLNSLGDNARVSVRDIVRAQARALDALGIERVRVVIGGSLGGMQALRWAVDAPERLEQAIVVGGHDHQPAMSIALNAIQRECLELDPIRGLRTARKLAMLTYKSEALFNQRHDRRHDRNDPSRFDIEGYLDYQADRFEARMDAATYIRLTHAMDSFDLREAQPSPEHQPEITFVGISSDWLFCPRDVRAAAARLGTRGFRTRYLEMETVHGHDAFLAEAPILAKLLAPLLE